MAQLSVGLDLVAHMRAARKTGLPDPAQAAVLAEIAGSDGIAIGLRRDRKFIRDRDLFLLREMVKTRLTIIMPPAEEVIEQVLEVKPTMVVLVADHADGDAPASGIDFANAPIDFSVPAMRFKGAGVAVCYFIEPENDMVKAAGKAQADAVMINCGGFTAARTLGEAQNELDRIDRAAQAAAKAELTVCAGRGINYQNCPPLVELNLIDEFFVGKAIVSQAVLTGMDAAVKQMKGRLQTTSSGR